MYQAILQKLSTLATRMMTDGSMLMIDERGDTVYFSTIILIGGLLTAGLLKKYGGLFKGRNLGIHGDPDRVFEKQRLLILKKCPNCAEELSLSALICDGCDYNFLSGMIGRGQKLLPTPEPLTPKVSKPTLASSRR
jgi:hypothetical protein